MIVWRIEHPLYNRSGPYCPEYAYNKLPEEVVTLRSKLQQAHGYTTTHPGPYNDGIRNFGRRHFCGFRTLRDLKTWFKGWDKDLAAAGFVIAQYKVSKTEVAEGCKQLMFVREHAILVKEIVPKF